MSNLNKMLAYITGSVLLCNFLDLPNILGADMAMFDILDLFLPWELGRCFLRRSFSGIYTAGPMSLRSKPVPSFSMLKPTVWLLVHAWTWCVCVGVGGGKDGFSLILNIIAMIHDAQSGCNLCCWGASPSTCPREME